MIMTSPSNRNDFERHPHRHLRHLRHQCRLHHNARARDFPQVRFSLAKPGANIAIESFDYFVIVLPRLTRWKDYHTF